MASPKKIDELWDLVDLIYRQVATALDYARVIELAATGIEDDGAVAIATVAADLAVRCDQAIADLDELQKSIIRLRRVG